ncbi:MAG: hypothetical protein ACRENA_16210 [Vulcanimicrobiaceae bacterium]
MHIARVRAMLGVLVLAGTALNACSRSSEAQQQAAYAKAIANEVITKFILRDATDPAHIIGAYAVIKAQQTDSGAIWCTYETPGAGTSSASSFVRLLKIQSQIEQNRLFYSVVDANDALGIMQAAPKEGDGMSKIAEILGARPAGYDPFPTNANGERHFLFTACKLSQ